MTSQAKINSNRLNALKSTGPKSRRGKAKSSQNSKKHGMTSRADPRKTLKLFRDILDDVSADPESAMGDATSALAIRLAMTEAHLTEIKRSELEFLEDYPDYFDKQPNDEGYIEGLTKYELYGPNMTKREAIKFLRLVGLGVNAGAFAAAEKFKLIRRYLREAEAAHTKALKAWCQSDRQISRNEAK